MLVRNADAVIVHGNTLSLENFGGYQPRRSVFGGEIRTLSAEQASTFLTATVKTQGELVRTASPEGTGLNTSDATEPAPEAEPPQPFMVDRKGQMGFDF